MKSDIEIARSVAMDRIEKVAERAGIDAECLDHYGKYIAKLPLSIVDEAKVKKSRLILVTAITATKAGIGKTTVSVGLALGLNRIGKRVSVHCASRRWVRVSASRVALPAAVMPRWFRWRR